MDKLGGEKGEGEMYEECNIEIYNRGFSGGSDGKVSACSVGDLGLILGLGRSPREGNGNHSSTLAWRITWTEEPGRLQSMELQRVRHD